MRNHGFWLPKGRTVIKKLLNKCITCKKLNSFSFKYPKRTDYIGDRVNFVKPFLHTGIDYTGHFFVKMGDETVKMYLLLFVCLNIRAIHMELLPDMTTANFLLAFIRFSNKYCIPDSVYSDNAVTFKQGGFILQNCDADDDLTEYLQRHNIKIRTIPLYSAWVGSAWERMIRIVKDSLYKTIGRKKLEYFQMFSILSDVQNAVNSRPLTYRDADNLSLDIISPNSFLKFDDNRTLLFGNLEGSDIEIPTHKKLVLALSKREEIFEHFKNLWYESYLLSLREESRNLYDKDWEDKIRVNDIV